MGQNYVNEMMSHLRKEHAEPVEAETTWCCENSMCDEHGEIVTSQNQEERVCLCCGGLLVDADAYHNG